jgi:hypothetical protein
MQDNNQPRQPRGRAETFGGGRYERSFQSPCAHSALGFRQYCNSIGCDRIGALSAGLQVRFADSQQGDSANA